MSNNTLDQQADRLGYTVERVGGWTTVRAGMFVSTFPEHREPEITDALAKLRDKSDPQRIAMTCTRALAAWRIGEEAG